jgi:DNA-binding transcriptional LysR family regulator
LSQLDLNLLVVLETVLAERSVARAARRLHVTPSAISNSLARLRQALGDPLVTRSGRGIVPTPRAATLVPALGRALRDIHHAIYGQVFDPDSATGQFTLAMADAAQIVQAPKLAADFARAMPRAKLRVVGIDTLLSSGGLAGTDVDVALAALEKSPGVHVEPLYDEQSVLVGRSGHPLAATAVSKKQLGSLRHVDVQVAPGKGYRELASTYSRLGIPRDTALVVPSFVAAAAIVADTDFVATLPESLVRRFGKAYGIRVLTPSAPRVSITLKLAWHERTDHDPAMKAFRQLVASSVLSLRKATAAKRRRR